MMPGTSVLSSFSLVGTSTGSDTSIEINGLSIASGDLAFIFNTADGSGSNPADDTPSGFTKLRTALLNTRRCSIFAKILDGTETTVTGLDGASGEEWILLVLRPDATLSSFVDNDTGNNQATSGNPSSQTITASGETPPVVLYGVMHSSSAVNPRTTSPTMTEISGPSTNVYAHYYIYNDGDTPANHTYDKDDDGTNFLQSGYLTFT